MSDNFVAADSVVGETTTGIPLAGVPGKRWRIGKIVFSLAAVPPAPVQLIIEESANATPGEAPLLTLNLGYLTSSGLAPFELNKTFGEGKAITIRNTTPGSNICICILEKELV